MLRPSCQGGLCHAYQCSSRRCLPPTIYADVRYIDDVIASFRPEANEVGSCLESMHFNGDDVRPGAKEVLALAAKMQAGVPPASKPNVGGSTDTAAGAEGTDEKESGAGASSSATPAAASPPSPSPSSPSQGGWAEENKTLVVGGALAVAIAAYLIWKKQ